MCPYLEFLVEHLFVLLVLLLLEYFGSRLHFLFPLEVLLLLDESLIFHLSLEDYLPNFLLLVRQGLFLENGTLPLLRVLDESFHLAVSERLVYLQIQDFVESTLLNLGRVLNTVLVVNRFFDRPTRAVRERSLLFETRIQRLVVVVEVVVEARLYLLVWFFLTAQTVIPGGSLARSISAFAQNHTDVYFLILIDGLVVLDVDEFRFVVCCGCNLAAGALLALRPFPSLLRRLGCLRQVRCRGLFLTAQLNSAYLVQLGLNLPQGG